MDRKPNSLDWPWTGQLNVRELTQGRSGQREATKLALIYSAKLSGHALYA